MLLAKLKAKHDQKMLSKLPPEEVAKLLESGALLVDVRSKVEALVGIAPGATNIPLSALKRHMAELPRDKDIVLYCGTGARAGKAKKSWTPRDSRRLTAAATTRYSRSSGGWERRRLLEDSG